MSAKKHKRSYFLRFGYLPASNSPENPDSFDEPLKSAVFSYQKSLDLPLTGKLDAETLGQIVSPRCGISDGQIDLLLPMAGGRPGGDDDDGDDEARCKRVVQLLQDNKKDWLYTYQTS